MVRVKPFEDNIPDKAYRIKLKRNRWMADNNGSFIVVDNEKFACIFFDRNDAENELEELKDLFYPEFNKGVIEVVK